MCVEERVLWEGSQEEVTWVTVSSFLLVGVGRALQGHREVNVCEESQVILRSMERTAENEPEREAIMVMYAVPRRQLGRNVHMCNKAALDYFILLNLLLTT